MSTLATGRSYSSKKKAIHAHLRWCLHDCGVENVGLFARYLCILLTRSRFATRLLVVVISHENEAPPHFLEFAVIELDTRIIGWQVSLWASRSLIAHSLDFLCKDIADG